MPEQSAEARFRRRRAAAHAEVVGMSIAEHMPWDAINLKTMLEAFPFMR